MKNLPKFLLASAMAITLGLSCDTKNTDYACSERFKIVNRSSTEIFIIENDVISQTIRIGEEGIVSKLFGLCGKNTLPQDGYSFDQTIDDVAAELQLSPQTIAPTHHYVQFTEMDSVDFYILNV